jgi:hypothetical protein
VVASFAERQDIAGAMPPFLQQPGQDALGGHPGRDGEASARLQAPADGRQEYPSGRPIEIRETVAEAISAVEHVRPWQVAHVGGDPLRLHRRSARFGNVFETGIDAGHPAATLRQFDSVTSAAAGDVEEARTGLDFEDALQSFDFGGSDFGGHGEAPEIQRHVTKKVEVPIGWHFFS